MNCWRKKLELGILFIILFALLELRGQVKKAHSKSAAFTLCRTKKRDMIHEQ